MRINHVKRKLNDGGTSIGTFMFEFNTTGIGRIAAEAGAAFAVFDMEHTGWSIESIRMLVATSRSGRRHLRRELHVRLPGHARCHPPARAYPGW